MNSRRMPCSVALGLLLSACGGDPVGPDPGGGPPPPPPPPVTACAQATDVNLQPGGHVVIDPAANSGCVRFPVAPFGGAEYVYTAVATNGRESATGSSVTYEIRGTPAATAMVAASPETGR
jgi:hypothetical protein